MLKPAVCILEYMSIDNAVQTMTKEFRNRKKNINLNLNVLMAAPAVVVLLPGSPHETYTSPYLLPVRGLNEIFIGESLSSR